jgi:predicted CoA-binding protein
MTTTPTAPAVDNGVNVEALLGAREVVSEQPAGAPFTWRASNFVATYLTRTPLTIYPVNPRADEVLGLRCYPSLADLPEVPDIVDIFRAPDAIPGVVDEAIAVGAKVVWFQLGLRHDGAARTALDAGLQVVQDRCLKIELARYAGGLHYGGFVTGVVTSRRRRSI